jgi:thiol:disulfide interchange protein
VPQKHQPATLPRQVQPEAQPTAKKPDRFLAALVIASIAVIILGIILLKERPQVAVALPSVQSGSPTAQSSSPAARSGAATQDKPAAAVAGPLKPSSLMDQLDLALANKKPVLVFMHSNNCQSCIDMMKIVNQVYPEFADQIVLIDVDVYDDANAELMERLKLRYIPTIVVYNNQGRSWQNIGPMQEDGFRAYLRQRALGG